MKYIANILFYCISFAFASQAHAKDWSSVRTVDDQYVKSNDVINISVELVTPGVPPSPLIIVESLPPEWTVINAKWNGLPMPPTLVDGEYKWLFGFGVPVGSGTLTYNINASGSSGETFTLTGKVLYSTETVVTSGDRWIAICGVDDFDCDGISDDWEIVYGLNPSNELDAVENWDDDIFINRDEYISGTDPTNSGSCFTLTNVRNSSSFIIEWPSVSNRLYSVRWTTDIALGFSTLTNTLEYPVNSYTNILHATEPMGFYKVDVRLNP